jgi:hypothetical protein
LWSFLTQMFTSHITSNFKLWWLCLRQFPFVTADSFGIIVIFWKIVFKRKLVC